MREILTTDAVYRCLVEKGGDADLIYVCDDYDPLRKVYPHLPASYEQYVGKALSEFHARVVTIRAMRIII